MSTITAILDASADGSLHQPLPSELKGARIRVVAQLEAVPASEAAVHTAREARDCWEKAGRLIGAIARCHGHEVSTLTATEFAQMPGVRVLDASRFRIV